MLQNNSYSLYLNNLEYIIGLEYRRKCLDGIVIRACLMNNILDYFNSSAEYN